MLDFFAKLRVCMRIYIELQILLKVGKIYHAKS